MLNKIKVTGPEASDQLTSKGSSTVIEEKFETVKDKPLIKVKRHDRRRLNLAIISWNERLCL